jgi:hypothetical protein
MTRHVRRNRVLAVVAVLLTLSAAGYGFVIRPMQLAITQIQNFKLLDEYAEAIDASCARTRSYPEALREVMKKPPVYGRRIPIGEDMWGHPISYSRLADGYLLVSFGRDGMPDGTDYQKLRLEGVQDERPCRNPDADVIFSDRGRHRTCGK